MISVMFHIISYLTVTGRCSIGKCRKLNHIGWLFVRTLIQSYLLTSKHTNNTNPGKQKIWGRRRL